MKSRILYLALFLLLIPSFIQAQDDQPDTRPVRNPMESTVIIDNPSFLNTKKGQFEMMIIHRFGEIKTFKDLFGIYAPSNIRMGFNYGITDKLMVGLGSEKNNKQQDLFVKYMILQQTRSNNIPLFLTYYSAIGIDARNEEVFGQNYSFTGRLSYFNELIVGRMFTKKLSLQAAANFTHFNAVDSIWKNDYVGFSAGGRFKVTDVMSVICEYDQAFPINKNWDFQESPKPNLGVGIEIGTSTHCFQVFASQYDAISPQKNFANNTNELKKMHVGFNIVVRF